ncbi:MAG: UBA/THIF-type binding protein [Nevskia sp.]|nr:UBA/THIF-type binding protein [Nevskia sp.]
MTPGQERAVRELRRLCTVGPNEIDFEEPALMSNNWLDIPLSLRIGPVEHREGGLRLKDRERLSLLVPPDFPFRKPVAFVEHDRFAGFPHVVWGTTLCLYQSELEWNPSDGLYGYFTRLSAWLGRAAANDMDPVEGPLEPPHHITDFSKTPFLISFNAPVAAGTGWVGLAELSKKPNRIEIVGWHQSEESIPQTSATALVVLLPERLPMEFPRKGKDFFRELEKQHLDRDRILNLLRLAASYGEESDPVYVVLGSPSRRGPDGTPKHHFAVWAAHFRKSLKVIEPTAGDNDVLAHLRKEIADLIYSSFEDSDLTWCPVLDDRSEIIVRRDRGRPMAWFEGKRVLLLGCGALGSWAGEMIARANPALLDLVDQGQVKPGLLIRQNFTRDDIGAAKATALAQRLGAFSKAEIKGYDMDAHQFLIGDVDRAACYDLIIDCTASRIFQMKLERDWGKLAGKLRRLASLVIDGQAQNAIAVDLSSGSAHGPWIGYLRLKQALCGAKRTHVLLDAFYSDQAIGDLFQPEPGCSDPTFAGSAVDAVSLAGDFLNLIASRPEQDSSSMGYAFSSHAAGASAPIHELVPLLDLDVITVGQYRVFVSPVVYESARNHVTENNQERSRRHETGGLLWGYWDDAANVIVIFDASGPPPDSRHDPGHFECGTRGTKAEHARRSKNSRGSSDFIGMWHTHPGMSPKQSMEDVAGMAGLVAGLGQNQRRALMMIFGRLRGRAEVGLYVYESIDADRRGERLAIGEALVALKEPVV